MVRQIFENTNGFEVKVTIKVDNKSDNLTLEANESKVYTPSLDAKVADITVTSNIIPLNIKQRISITTLQIIIIRSFPPLLIIPIDTPVTLSSECLKLKKSNLINI